MTVNEFARMVKDVWNAKLISQGPEYSLTEEEKKQTIFRRSIFAIKDIKKGEIFTRENLGIIRPGYGLAPKYINQIIGKKSTRNIERGEPIKMICGEVNNEFKNR